MASRFLLPRLLPLRVVPYPSTLGHRFIISGSSLRHSSKKAARNNSPPSQIHLPKKHTIQPPSPAKQAKKPPSQKSSSSSSSDPPPHPSATKAKLKTAVKVKPSAAAAIYTLEEALGLAGKETLLYSNHSRVFLIGCYGICAGSIGWIGYNYWTNIVNERPGLAKWVRWVNWVGIGLMGLVVGVTAFYPTRLIQKIHAVPIPATRSSPPRISILLYRRPLIPFFPLRKIPVSSPSAITLEKPLKSPSSSPNSPLEKEEGGIIKRILGIPGLVFKGFKQLINTEDFVPLRVKGVGKLGVYRYGWVWKSGGLEKLFVGEGRKKY